MWEMGASHAHLLSPILIEREMPLKQRWMEEMDASRAMTK